MGFVSATDYFVMARPNGSGGEDALRMPILDAIMQTLTDGGVFYMTAGNTPPLTNQNITLWLNTAIPSYSQQGVLMAWNPATNSYVVATPPLVFRTMWEAALQAGLGVDGNTLTGNLGGAAPSNATVGVNGDYFIDLYNGNVWGPKAAGVWPGSPVNIDPAAMAAAANALSVANTAIADAGAAAAAAAAAQTAANTALSDAEAAQSTANTALADAEAAQSAANAAQASANEALAEIAALVFPGVANTTTNGLSREATIAEATAGVTSGSVPAFVTPEGVKAAIEAAGGGGGSPNPFTTTGVGAVVMATMTWDSAGGNPAPGTVLGNTGTLQQGNPSTGEQAADGFMGGGADTGPLDPSGDLFVYGFDYRWVSANPPGTWTFGGIAAIATEMSSTGITPGPASCYLIRTA